MKLLCLVITAPVVRSLSGYEKKLNMMQCPRLEEPGKLLLHFIIMKKQTKQKKAHAADLAFQYPAHVNLYRMFSSRVTIRNDETSWFPPCSLACPLRSHSLFVFLLFTLLAFQTRKGSNILTLCPWKGCSLRSLDLTHPFQGETHLIKQKSPDYLRKVGRGSFQP